MRLFLSLTFVAAVTTLAAFNLPAAIAAIAASILAVAYPKIDSIIEISFGPLKAKLERNVTASELLLKRLSEFAVVQGRTAASAPIPSRLPRRFAGISGSRRDARPRSA